MMTGAVVNTVKVGKADPGVRPSEGCVLLGQVD